MSVTVDEHRRIVAIHTDHTSYAFGVDPAGLLRHLYWGPRVPRCEDFEAPTWYEVSSNDLLSEITPEEYPWHGGFRSKETAVGVRFASGVRELRPQVGPFRAEGEQAEGEQLAVDLVDPRGVRITLHYRVLAEVDLIERWATITNSGDEPISVTHLASAQFHLPRPGLRLHNVSGHWGAEQQAFTQPVGRAKSVLESRRGISSHHHNPYVLLDAGATEEVGEAWCMALAWSGNFRAVVEPTPYGDTLVQMGLNPYDSEIALAPGEEVVTPRVVAGYCDAGLAELSHRLHAYGRSLLDPRPRPVLYNSWEATGFAVTAAGQSELVRRAAEIGVELFVIDDGWFGRRDSIDDGLGDWWASPAKFPDGLGPLIADVTAAGMAFGLWVEPEMVSPASDLYADHPDWIYRDPAHPPDTARGQFVLDLTRPEVVEHLFEVLTGLLSEHDISYLKWDANRPLSAVGADRDVYRRHIANLYALVSRLKAAHPGVLVEACASGGGRVDFGALGVFDDVWTSDDTDAADRLAIQRAFSLVYPAKAMRAWITDVPNFLSGRTIPLSFRAHSAMTGSLGIGMDLQRATDDERASLAGHIATYKRLRPLIAEGLLWRLQDDSGNDSQVVGFSAPDGSHVVVFVFLQSSRLGHRRPRVRPRGLHPDRVYRYSLNYQTYERSGQYLSHVGVEVWLRGDYDSALLEFVAVS